MRVPRRLLSAALAAACLCVGTVPTAAASAAPFPQPGQGSPPGANDPACRPSAAHPRPVVLVHGLGANMSENWSYLSPLLAAEGYCVFALTYGIDPRATIPPFDQMGGVVPMEQSAQQLSTFVNQVLTGTGASRVDIVGHSEGSLMPDWYVRFLDGAVRVDRYVGITPLWHGTNVLGLATLNQYGQPLGLSPPVVAAVEQICGSCPEFLTGSPFIEKLNSGSGPAAPGVTYTNLMTRYDEAVVPYTSGALNAPGITNLVVQDQCPNDLSEHGGMAYDPVVARDVLNALDPAHARPVTCAQLPGIGMTRMVPSRFQTAVESGDAEAVCSCLAENTVFNSPVVFTPYRGRDAVAPLLTAALDVFQDFRYTGRISEGDREVLVFEARVGDRRVQGVDVLRLDEDGLVAELTVMLRPMSAVVAMAEAMRQRLAPA